MNVIILIQLLMNTSNAFESIPRVLHVPAIPMTTIHGDIMCANPAGSLNLSECIEHRYHAGADLFITGLESLGTGVLEAKHEISIKVKNLSEEPQTIQVTLLPTTKFTFGWSDINHTPGNISPSFSLPITQTVSLASSPSSTKEIAFLLICNFRDKSCCLSYKDNACSDPSIGMGAPILTLTSSWSISISVVESSGAVIGSIRTFAHRSMGVVDRYSRPQFIPLNGGKSF